jgi:hypothetical protein
VPNYIQTGEATLLAFLTWILHKNDWIKPHSKLPESFSVRETADMF